MTPGYVAGFCDGEAHVEIARIRVSQKHPAVLHALAAHTGLGHVRDAGRGAWEWYLGVRAARRLAAEYLLPHGRCKVPQARLVLAWGRVARALPAGALRSAARRALARECARLKGVDYR